ncbi:hypothetical protein V7149_01670 [Bacillus sp. JJ1503]|uniref:hypothetical protein n=1 Tax=Bacillus sp. JJ1503 TaxID=3122956 RepID=UPI002FFEED25
MFPVTIRRQRKYEAEQAIKDLEARGFKVIYPLTEHSREGKLFDRDSFNRKIFVENTQSSCWIAKLRKVD